jgi:hypothetical protein
MAEIERMRKRTAEFTMPICRKQALESISLSFLTLTTYNQETISFFKTIGVKGKLYNNVSKLEVKDEDD